MPQPDPTDVIVVEQCQECPFHGTESEYPGSYCNLLSYLELYADISGMGGEYKGPPPEQCPLRRISFKVVLKAGV